MTENEIAREVVDVAYRVHARFGPGLFEHIYEAIMARELEKRGMEVKTQHPMPVIYNGTRYEMGYRADMVIDDKVIVEVKSISDILPIHKKQLLTYLRLADLRLGLLINFEVMNIKNGITRIANGLIE